GRPASLEGTGVDRTQVCAIRIDRPKVPDGSLIPTEHQLGPVRRPGQVPDAPPVATEKLSVSRPISVHDLDGCGVPLPYPIDEGDRSAVGRPSRTELEVRSLRQSANVRPVGSSDEEVGSARVR